MLQSRCTRADHFHADSDRDDARDGRGERHQGDAEGEGSKDVEPSALTPTVIETMHATGKVSDTKAMPKARSPKTTSQALSRR